MIFGQYEYTTLDINKLIVLPQVRKIKNAKIDEIKESIEDQGLINPLDVAKLEYEEFKKHIEFLNKLWKKEIDIDCYEATDGHYYVVIAGHSRLEAIKQIAKSRNCDVEVVAKVHNAKTSEEIIAIQLDENIYQGTRIEERAIAIIETYRIGIANNKWQDKNEFVAQNKNKFSKNILKDALVFADLPIEVQEYVFTNNIPFAAGVELGRIYPLIEKYEHDVNQADEFLSENIKLHYAVLLIKLQKAKSVKRAISMISSHCQGLKDHFRPEDDLQQETINWWLGGVGAEHQGEVYRKELEKEYNSAVFALTSMPFDYFVKLFDLDANLTGKDHSEDVQAIKKLYLQYSNRINKRGK